MARFYMLTGTQLIDLCEYAVPLIISYSSCLDVVIAYAISLLKTKTQTSLRFRAFVICLLESIIATTSGRNLRFVNMVI